MPAVVPRARIGAAFKVALVAGYLFCPLRISAEHLSSSCSTLPSLVSTSLASPRQSRFSLHTSLRQQGSIRPTVNSTLAQAISLDLDIALQSPPSNITPDFEVPAWERSLAPRLKLASDTSRLPHLLSWLEGWRMDIEKGLFRPIGLRASRLAFAYTDIFDTRGHPDKGSHGLGFLFRYDFRKAPDRL